MMRKINFATILALVACFLSCFLAKEGMAERAYFDITASDVRKIIVAVPNFTGNAGVQGSAVSQITSPSDGTVVAAAPMIITGTASSDRSPLASVEVSFDDGTTWLLATGLESWFRRSCSARDARRRCGALRQPSRNCHQYTARHLAPAPARVPA